MEEVSLSEARAQSVVGHVVRGDMLGGDRASHQKMESSWCALESFWISEIADCGSVQV